MVKGNPVQLPVTDTGITMYSTVPVVVAGLVRIWSRELPVPALAPVTPPVMVPTVQVYAAGTLAIRLIPVPVPLQIVLVAEVVTAAVGFTVIV